MAEYSVWICSPMGYSHSQAFSHLAIALQSGFRELGHECNITPNYWDAKGTAIVLGANLLNVHSYLPENPIIFNLEQITPGSPWLTEGYIELLKKYKVWDYSYNNIVELSKFGISASYCGIGYAPELSCIPEPVNQPTDVLMYGSQNERRTKIATELSKYCDVSYVFNVYGDELNHMIGRAKIVLNTHFYDSKVFEIIRCSYLMANRKCIVSEFGEDFDLEQPFYDGICFADYDEIVEKCVMLLKSPDIRHVYENKGFEIFSGMKQSEYLKAVI